jgi:hypothetical protein
MQPTDQNILLIVVLAASVSALAVTVYNMCTNQTTRFMEFRFRPGKLPLKPRKSLDELDRDVASLMSVLDKVMAQKAIKRHEYTEPDFSDIDFFLVQSEASRAELHTLLKLANTHLTRAGELGMMADRKQAKQAKYLADFYRDKYDSLKGQMYAERIPIH